MPGKTDDVRRDERLKFITKCLLEVNGKKYDCLVDDISTVGASIEITAPHPLQVGDSGSLAVLLLSPVHYLCKVVRINADQIGVKFV